MEELTHLRKRLLYQSQRQGTREIDLLLGEFATQHLASMTFAELKELETVISVAVKQCSGKTIMQYITQYRHLLHRDTVTPLH